MSVEIVECTSPTQLYRHYPRESEPQPVYLQLDLETGTLEAIYHGMLVGGGVPQEVVYGYHRRYRVPVLTGDAANRIMREIAPLAERVIADWDRVHRGERLVAVLGPDAQAAEAAIEQLISDRYGDGDDLHQDPDVVQEWPVDAVTTGSEADEYGITGDTTDARLDEIEQQILRDRVPSSTAVVVVCHGLDTYLQQLRDDLADQDPLTPAELRAAREALGLTGDQLARVLAVNPRTVRSWEQGRDPVPGRIRPLVAELRETTREAVDTLTARMEELPPGERTLITYRGDEELQQAGPYAWRRMSAAWHRRVCAQAAERTGARITYGPDPDED